MVKRFLRYEIICEWCRKRDRSSRPDTRTCSGKCRQRMNAFERELGYAPRSIPGDVTAKVAIDLEIMRLVRAERERLKERGEHTTR